MEIRDVLAHNLRTQRRAKGLSQEELAHRAGIDVVDRLARELGLEASDLLKRPNLSAKKRGPSDGGGRK